MATLSVQQAGDLVGLVVHQHDGTVSTIQLETAGAVTVAGQILDAVAAIETRQAAKLPN